jgi:RimJ/RimL family protein N-acetyltransferase
MLIEASDTHFHGLLNGIAPAGLRIADGGIESDAVLSMLRGLASSVRNTFSPAAWLVVEQGVVVGLCSLLAAPDDTKAVAIGYGIAGTNRGRGFCTKAVRDIVLWAQSNPAITSLTAETAIDNLASQYVLKNNGFKNSGKRTDIEDGDLLCWQICVAVDTEVGNL